MYKIQTQDGERFLVQLTGPRSYRFKGMHITRGGTLTVTKRTRDYLVKKTGFFSDYDPTPEEPVDEVLPPQFGQPGGPTVDESDFDMKSNPPLSQQEAMRLAMQGQAVDQNGAPVTPDADLGEAEATAPELDTGTERGDASSEDFKPDSTGTGGAAAKTTTKATPTKATKTGGTSGAKTGGTSGAASKSSDEKKSGITVKSSAQTID